MSWKNFLSSIPGFRGFFRKKRKSPRELLEPENLHEIDEKEDFYTLLDLSVHLDKPLAIRYLFEKNYISRIEILERTARYNSIQIFREYFQPEFQEEFLIRALIWGNLDLVRFLVEEVGAVLPVNCVDYAHRHIKVVNYLENRGFKFTPGGLIAASINGNFGAVKYIVEKVGIPANYDDSGAVARASYWYHKEIAFYLVSKGGDYKKLHPDYKEEYLKQKFWKKWRRWVLVKKLRERVLPIYFSPGFPGWLKGRKEVELIVE